MITSKLPATGTTIFTVMSALAKEHGAINLSQGFPDFPCPPALQAALERYIEEGFNQYAHMAGAISLRQAIANKVALTYGANINPDTDVTVTAGGTQAIFTAIACTIHAGDEVIYFTPAYDSYAPAILLQGGKPIAIELQHPSYNIPWQQVKDAITPRTRMIIINTPHNPSGTVMTAADMKTLQELVRDTNILILSDEVYEHIVFDGARHESVLRYPELAARSFVVYSFGKTYYVTGWKMGYCIAPEALMREFRKVHQYLVFSVNHPAQLAFGEIMETQPRLWQELPQFYQRKRDLFIKHLQGSRFTISPSQGTYFQLLGYENITDEPDTALAARWTKEIGVASIPVSVFYNPAVQSKVLRFCFAKSDEVLEAAAEKLCKI
jgi:methionine transaminase